MHNAVVVDAPVIDSKAWNILEAALIGFSGFFVFLTLLRVSAHLISQFGLIQWLTWFQLREFKTLISTVVTVLILTPVISLLIRSRRLGGWLESIEWNAGRYAFRSILLGAILAVVWSSVTIAFHDTPGSFHERGLSIILYLLSEVIVGPVVEEMYFRGMLFVALAKRLGPVMSIMIVTGIFVLVHPGHTLNVLPVAVTLGIARLKTKSVASCFVLHASYNFFLLIYLLL